MSIIPNVNLSKYQKFAKLGFNDEALVINDLNAYQDPRNQTYRIIYNRLFLAQWQGLKCNPMPIPPKEEDYPVIIKPIINLYGLSLDCHIIHDEDEFYDKYWLNTGFWTEFLEGNSTSTDLIIQNGEILWTNTFKGYLPEDTAPGVYTHWKLKKNFRVKKIIRRLVEEYLQGYSGLLNVECIGPHIIEAHLRMGDLDQLVETQVLRSVGHFIQSDFKEWTLPIDFLPHRIYLVPVFLLPDQDLLLSEEQVIACAIGCLFYQIDSRTTAHPPTAQRVVMLTCDNLERGFLARDRILELNKSLDKQNKNINNESIINKLFKRKLKNKN